MRTICYMILFLTFPCQSVQADSIYESLTESDSDYWPADLPANTIILEDISYGEFERQKFDVYIPENASSAPVIFLVHGGGWRLGNKSSNRLLNNKLGRWLSQGFIFISTNYRLLPDTDPLEQANDVALSLSTAQEKAPSWGGDPEKFILMGHSAGGHLVSMLTAAPSRYYPMNVRPWLGSVILDSAALNIVQLMSQRHLPLYDYAFGEDPDYWKKISPYELLEKNGPPVFAVCSRKRIDNPCNYHGQFNSKALEMGRTSSLMRLWLTHGEINSQLGKNSDYTEAVESFIYSLL